MNSKDDFLKKLLLTFKLEAQEHTNVMSLSLIKLEKESNIESQVNLIEIILREAHSLKGAARSVNMSEIESICQSLESVFVALKRQQLPLSETLINSSHKAIEILDSITSNIGDESYSSKKSKVSSIVRQLENVFKVSMPVVQVVKEAEIVENIKNNNDNQNIEQKTDSESIQNIEPIEKPFIIEKNYKIDTVRLSTRKLDAILLKTEELLSVKLITEQRAIDLKELELQLNQWKKQWNIIQPELQKNQQLTENKSKLNKHSNNPRILDFLEWSNNYVKSLESKITKISKAAETDRRLVGGMVDSLLSDMKKIVMLPISSLLEIFPKIVRELSHDQGKNVELIVSQADIEIDRRILEEIKDPLIHLIRNSIDHGIESSSERELKKKPSCAKVSISIIQNNSSSVELIISDDGAGVDLKKLKQTVLKLGLSTQEDIEKLSDSEILNFIFYSGVSTSPIITDISGRGLGLAIVSEKIEKLGGTISVKSNKDIGTTFHLLLPITLTTFHGLIIRLQEHLFVIPVMNVERVTRINKENIKTIENKETIQLQRQVISFVRLSDILELKRKDPEGSDSKFILVVVLKIAEKCVAFEVDEVLSEQEVLVKSLGKQLKRIRNIIGATILGTGRVVPIINTSDLIKSAIKFAALSTKPSIAIQKEEVKRKSILIAEDSITARTLVKNILESAGYKVQTAVDGLDALTILKTEAFDLVISDIDMPRMSGLDLASKIRADKKLSNLPIILVTALEKREDKERGIDVGANAYIVKSSFDQSNLLEVVQRLI